MAKLVDVFTKAARDFENRAEGLRAEIYKKGEVRPATDEVIHSRIRSKLGRYCAHPHAIKVDVKNGEATLEGPILKAELTKVLSVVKNIEGVRQVFNRLEEHDKSENIPGLQGGREAVGEKGEIFQENWPPAYRVLVAWLGTALVAVGVLSIIRAYRNKPLLQLLVRKKADEKKVSKVLYVDARLKDTYDYLTNLQNLSSAFPYNLVVRQIDKSSFLFSVHTLSVSLKWHAELTDLVPNQYIEWRSITPSVIDIEQKIRFYYETDSRTRIDIETCYSRATPAADRALLNIFGDVSEEKKYKAS